ncbi:alanine racemase [Alpinimonas psychrophila]|uniref:Alanine racemase n=1 Tax=Alpinimonas psychrophila TaxID=748908 RepID=A0A7W3JVT6_9MICO|nr:alanine racemase [Alpinimonas psychrophila]MBA8830067.1 alanine racemase [Alpinimonas psychrophila]
MSHTPFREAVINLDALANNVAQLKNAIGIPNLMIVVKANAYGHGMIHSARAALAGGAQWLGVADIDEALALREAGLTAPILAWIHAPDETFVEAVTAGVTLGISSLAQLRTVANAGAAAGLVARVHLKLETGLSRNGASEPEWAQLYAEAAALEASGTILVEGIFSHLSNTSEEDDLAQAVIFDRGINSARAAGLAPQLIHLAASVAAMTLPMLRYNMVRVGILAYGISPFEHRTAAELGLTPVMSLRTKVIATRRVSSETGVSYGYTYKTSGETTLALVPLGYGEGIPRAASGRGPVLIGGQKFTIAGRVAMDQFVVDVGDVPAAVGDDVVLFGDPAQGHPSVTEWAEAAATISYEIVTCMGGRLTRRFTGLDS